MLISNPSILWRCDFIQKMSVELPDLFELDFLNSFYTGIGHIVEDTVSVEFNNDNEKTEVSNNHCRLFWCYILLAQICKFMLTYSTRLLSKLALNWSLNLWAYILYGGTVMSGFSRLLTFVTSGMLCSKEILERPSGSQPCQPGCPPLNVGSLKKKVI